MSLRFLMPRACAALSMAVLAILAFTITAPSARALSDRDVAALGANATPTPAGGVLGSNGSGDSPKSPLDVGLPKILGRMALAMGIVFSLMGVAVWAARKFLPKGAVNGSRSGGIEVLVNRSLGSRRSLLLVRARGKTLLLGVTPQSIQSLAELEQEGSWSQAAWQSGLEDALAPQKTDAAAFPRRAPLPDSTTRPSGGPGAGAAASMEFRP